MSIIKAIYSVQPYADAWYPATPDLIFEPGVAVLLIINGEPYSMRFTAKDSRLIADSGFKQDDARVINHLLNDKQLSDIKTKATLHLRAHQQH
jgi:hypothetical protein